MTVLALKSVLPGMPMIAALSTNHLAALEFAPTWRRIYVARDVRHVVSIGNDFNGDLSAASIDYLRARLLPQLDRDDT
jgi:hypothetical protein